MKFLSLPALCALLFTTTLGAQNQPPVLSNVSATPNWAAQTLQLSYDLSDVENDAVEISVAISNTAGLTYLFSVPASGDVGFPVSAGSGKSISLDLSSLSAVTGPFTVRIVADDKQPFDLQALVNEVDSNRLKNDLAFVEGIRHRTTGAAHLAAVQDSLRHLFTNAGYFSGDQSFNYAGYTGHNLSGTLRGTVVGEQVVIVDAHYDSVNNAPGADDNGSGTVAVMEIARLLGRYPMKNTLRCIGFDLEEAGLVGSQRYLQSGLPAGEDILGVYNFEMIGYYTTEPNTQTVPTGFNQLFPAVYNAIAANQFRGDFLINVGNAASTALGAQFANAAAQYVPELKVLSIYPPGNSEIAPDLRRSDHARFWDAGHSALMLTDGANFRNACYHTPQDTLEKLNFQFMAGVTRATLAAAAQLAEIQHGDWETVVFQGTVGTTDPNASCQIRINADQGQSGALYITSSGCPLKGARLELFNLAGQQLYGQTLDGLDGVEQMINVGMPLTSGIYLAKISHSWGRVTQKVWIR